MQVIIEKPFQKLPGSYENSCNSSNSSQADIQEVFDRKQENSKEQKPNHSSTHPHEQYFDQNDFFDSFNDYQNGYSSSFKSQRLIHTSY